MWTNSISVFNLYRFSNFVKTGMEGYILATAKITAQPGEHHKIVSANGGGPNSKVEWHRAIDHYTCMVTKPKKESKLKGLRVSYFIILCRVVKLKLSLF